MRFALSLLALSLALPATAGTLSVEKKGLVPVFVAVDGVNHGKIKKKKPLVLDLADGMHEVWVSVEPSGTVTSCHGLVDVGPGGATVVADGAQRCTGLMEGIPASNSFFRGASILLNVDQELEAWVSVDGGQKLALPGLTYELNLTPGQHTIVLYKDIIDSAVLDQGTVTVGQGQRLQVTCTMGGCMGWDQPPVVVIVYEAPPPPPPRQAPRRGGISIDVSIPGVDVSIQGDTRGSMATTSAAAAAPSDGPGSCCVNGAYYDCPTGQAVWKCSGEMMACSAECGMTDPDCIFRCAELIDPSLCSRNPSNDGTCDD